MTSKWEKEADNIRKLVNEGMSDPEIAALYGVKPTTICVARSKLGIPTNTRTGEYRGGWNINGDMPVEQRQPVSEYKEGGVTVKVYPPLWAEGATQSFAVRPKKRGRCGEG